MLLRSFYKYLPLHVFIGIWGLVFFFYSLQLFNIRPVNSETLFLIIAGITAFILGYVLFALYDVNKIEPPKLDLAHQLNPDALAWLIVALSCTTLLGAGLIVLSVSTELGSAEAYLNTPIKVRNLFISYQRNPLTPPPISYKIGNYLINTGFAGTIFGGVLFAMKYKFRILGLLIVPAFLLASAATVGRYTLVNSLFFFIFAYVIATFFLNRDLQKRRLLEIFLFILFFVALLVIFTYYIIEFRTTFNSDNAVKNYALKTSYLYLTGGISAFDNYLAQDFSLAYGQSSFRSVFRWLIRFDLWPEDNLKVVHEPFTSITPAVSINTYTYIKSFFEDFGTAGVLILSFMFGGLSKLINYFALRQFSFIRLSIAITLIFAAFISFYSFYFHSVTTVIFRILVIIFIQYAFSIKLFKLKIDA